MRTCRIMVRWRLDELGSFVSHVYNEAKAKGWSVSYVIEQCEKVSESRREIRRFREDKDRVGQDRKRFPAKKEQLEEATNAYSILLSKYSVDEKTLKEFERVMESLAKLGLDLADLDETGKFLAEVKKNGYDSKKVVAKVSSIDDLESENTKVGLAIEKNGENSDGPAGQHRKMRKASGQKNRIVLRKQEDSQRTE